MASTTRGDEQRASSGRRSGGQPSTPRQHHGRVVSHTTGRIRVRLHPEHRQDVVLGEVQRQLQGQQGVAAVTTNTRTGSVLVQYDHHSLSRDDLMAMLHDAGSWHFEFNALVAGVRTRLLAIAGLRISR